VRWTNGATHDRHFLVQGQLAHEARHARVSRQRRVAPVPNEGSFQARTLIFPALCAGAGRHEGRNEAGGAHRFCRMVGCGEGVL
jgi:hypothetical protein